MRFYVASGLQNREAARSLIRHLSDRGHLPTYDWTEHGDVRDQGEAFLSSVALNEARAVCDAEFVVVLLPGGCGTHTELGLAIASRANKRILLWSETGDEFLTGKNTCAFYHHPVVERISCPFEMVGERVEALLAGNVF